MTFFLALLDSVSIYKCSDSTYLTNVYWAAGIRLCAMHWKQEKYKYDTVFWGMYHFIWEWTECDFK